MGAVSDPTRFRNVAALIVLVVCVPILWRITHSAKPPFRIDPDAATARTADAEVGRFHDRLTGRRYSEICRAAEPSALNGVTQLSCSDFLEYVRTHLGSVHSSRRTQLPVVEARSEGEPVRVKLGYATTFDNDTANEDFEWRVAGDKVTLTSYKVVSPALSP
jgi:hypothetical protein